MSSPETTALHKSATAAATAAVAALTRANVSIAGLIRNGREGRVVEAERFEAVGEDPASLADCWAVVGDPIYANRGMAPSARAIIRDAETASAAALEAIMRYEAAAGRPWRGWRPT